MGNESSTQSGSSSGSTTRRSSAAAGSSGNTFGAFVNNSNVSTSQAAQAGAYKMPGQPRNQRFYVTIPRGVRPGQHFAVLVNGQQMMVRCPDGNRPGDRLIVTAPRQQSQQYVVTVPNNVRQGQQFRVMINNQEVMVTCPRGVHAGQRVTFQLPEQERTVPPSPNHQMFEVTVPEGVKPGQPFALIANGQRVMVTCPPTVKPGQKIRFQLPVQLSNDQLAAIKVSYDKDGWMRCLGQDLKFHWVYNSSAASEEEAKKRITLFNVNEVAFVREFTMDSQKRITASTFTPATSYSIETQVPGTSVNYQELSSIAQLPFQQKADWLKNQFNMIRTTWEEGHMKVKVNRGSLLQDSMEALCSIEAEDMKKIFRFEFIGEPGLDAGGVTREWYELVSEQVFNPNCGFFLYSAVNQSCMQINPNSEILNEDHLRYFNLAGRLLGKALMDGQLTPTHLVQPLYKHFMGWPITLKDLEHIDDQVYRNLMELLDFDDVSQLFLDFNISEDKMGEVVNIELVPGGDDIQVTNENLPKYMEAQLVYKLHDKIKSQLLEMVKGFHDVVPEPLLSVFDFQELELLMHGLPNIDMSD